MKPLVEDGGDEKAEQQDAGEIDEQIKQALLELGDIFGIGKKQIVIVLPAHEFHGGAGGDGVKAEDAGVDDRHQEKQEKSDEEGDTEHPAGQRFSSADGQAFFGSHGCAPSFTAA